MDTDDDILEHHGIKGMKWGVRKDNGHVGETASTRVIAKADKKFEKAYRPSTSAWVKVNNEFAGHINPRLDELNNRPQFKNANLNNNKKAHDAYFKEYEKLVTQAASATEKSLGTNASGTRKVAVQRHGFGEDATWTAILLDVKHAATDEGNTLTFKVNVNELGQVVNTYLVDPSFAHSELDTVDEFFEHHGIKGMKWGTRRSQSQLNSGGGRVAGLKSGGVAHPDAKTHNTNHARTRAHGTATLSDTEMQKLVNRMNMEQNFSRLNSTAGAEAKIKKGHSYARAALAAGVTINSAILFAKSPAGQAIEKALKKQFSPGKHFA